MRSLVCLIVLFASREARTQQQRRVVPHPEVLAGRWETSDGRGGAIGMNIMLSTRIEGSPKTIDDQPQFEENFTVGLYQRAGTDVEQFSFNFFTTSADGGAVWNGHRLMIHLAPKADLPLVNVDLLWHDELHEWTGLFARGDFRGHVTLKRPTFDDAASPFIGTWFNSQGPINNCIHIARQLGGGFTAWSDDLQIPGRMRYANGIQPPAATIEQYGDIAKTTVEAPDQIAIELHANTAGCCPHPFSAKISAHGKTLSGNWPPGQWKKMPGNFCIGHTIP